MRPAPRPGFWAWLMALLRPVAPAAHAPSIGEQEARVIAEFSRHYRITFQRPELLKLALTHRSYLSVTGLGPRESNERLEFLGDSVLGLVTSEYLYLQHPNEHEGQLTKTKSLLVSKAILSRRGLAMGLGRFVLMSHSEIESGGRQRQSIVADAFEAVIGAIYLDQGFEAARAFIERWLLRDHREITADKRHTNYKSHLQEYVQSTFRTHPVYRIRSEAGPDHSKQFMVEVMVGRRSLGSGRGRNKKEAEQAAARDALERAQVRPDEWGAESAAPEAPAYEERGDREPREERREFPDREPREERHEFPDRRAPREEREAPARPAPSPLAARSEAPEVAPSALPPGDLPAAEEGAVPGGVRRRRGRRGGRGRRGRGVEAAPASIAAPAAAAPEQPARGVEPRAARRVVASPERPAPVARSRGGRAERPGAEDAAPEIEPRPRAYEEDENEEVGRPEGPLDERAIDPYETGAGRAEDEPGDFGVGGGARQVGTPFASPSLPEPEDEWPAELESESGEPFAVGPASEAGHDPDAGESTRGEVESEDDEPEPITGASDEMDAESEGEPLPWSPEEPEQPGATERESPRFGRRPGRPGRSRR
jgi:ribonuclease-3